MGMNGNGNGNGRRAGNGSAAARVEPRPGAATGRDRRDWRDRREPVRRLIEATLALLLLLLALPLLGVAALAVLVTSGRPVFYPHVRVGRDGRRFRCWKLRTMEVGAEERLRSNVALRQRFIENGYKLPVGEDPRVTRVGRWLRRSYVDEIPQLFNVLTGSMSLVGPRPVIAEELEEFSPDIHVLLSVRPGIFGAWNSRGNQRPSYPERALLELEYARNRSLRRDLAILARSLPVVLRGYRNGS